jgi:hypothetical protein
MQENVSCMELSVKIDKSVTSGELFWRELGRASFPQKQSPPLGDRLFHLHLTLMQDTYNIMFSTTHCIIVWGRPILYIGTIRC